VIDPVAVIHSKLHIAALLGCSVLGAFLKPALVALHSCELHA
jgi:hypothetical protein